MSDNIIFSATSNALGYTKIQVSTIDAPSSILDNTFMVQAVEEGAHRAIISILLSRNEIHALRDALTEAIKQAEIDDIMQLLK